MNNLIPFGKYKGQPVEVLNNDPQYLEWLRNQDWFISKYQQINNVVINNFSEPSETPEHNKLVAKFTEDKYVLALGCAVVNATKDGCKLIDQQKTEVRKDFETDKGADIHLFIIYRFYDEREAFEMALDVECKPVISDDFPAIIRQCKSSRSNVVVYDKFTATGLTLDQVKVMFGKIKLVSTDEIDLYYNYL